MNHQIERSSQDVGASFNYFLCKFAEVLCWIHPCGCPLFLGQGFEGDVFIGYFYICTMKLNQDKLARLKKEQTVAESVLFLVFISLLY